MNASRLLSLYERIADAPEAISRLRRFVLELAIRGKLVEQDASDEPASELLKRIKAETSRLVKAGEIRKPKAFPPLGADPRPFPIPLGWTWTQIAALGAINPRNEAPDDHEVSFVPMSRIAAEYGMDNGHERRLWGQIKRGYTHLAEGDVGLAKITPCFENGKSTVFRHLAGGIGAGTTELHVVRPLLVNAQYIVLFLKSPHFIESGVPRMTGTAGQKRVPIEYFTSTAFPLPPLAEQHRIVAKVDELMALLDRLEAARSTRETTRDRLTTASLTRLTAPKTSPEAFPAHARFVTGALPALTTRADQVKAFRQAILNLAVRGKLVEQDPNDEPAALPYPDQEPFSFDLPRGWRYVCLGRLLSENTRNGYSRRPDDAINGVPILRISAGTVRRDGLVAEEEHKLISNIDSATRLQFGLVPGDLLACRFNGNKAFVGRLTLFADYLGLDPIYPDKLIRVRLDGTFALPQFIRLAGDSDLVRGSIELLCATTVGNWGISASNLKEVPFPLPPLAEQHRIVAKVDELMGLCEGLESTLTTADTTKQRLLDALLQEALAGETSAREAA